MGDGTDTASELERLREPLQDFFSDQDRTDTVMRCIEEIVSDMILTCKNIHLKLRNHGEKEELIIRSLGKRDGLSSSISEKIKRLGDKNSVSYSYVYKMNIVCINLGKE